MTTLRVLMLAIWTLCVSFGQRVGAPTTDLDQVAVDELFSVQVTSVGRKAQGLAKAPAAVFVLTGEEIRRSGASSIPEALQLVPGLTVLPLDGRSWIVSARGSARLYSDKMLVMIDGRSLYTPFFSGVVWDAVGVPLEDVEQIEVVRGPGAVMWGPNAVNGVINIITKNSRATKGGQTAVATGNDLSTAAELRWGAGISGKVSFRVWAKADYLTPAYGSYGFYNYSGIMTYRVASIRDLDAATGRFGFRMDSQPSLADQWMLQGDLFRTDRHDPLLRPVLYPTIMTEWPGHSDYQGGFVQARWINTSRGGTERTLQFSYDKLQVDYANVGGDTNNLNVNLEWRKQTGERNELYWGAGYQQYWDDTQTGKRIRYHPVSATFRTADVVLRDEFQLVPDRLVASAGLRLDYGTFHRLEYQPSVRLLYTPSKRQSAWLAVSRAVRTPNRVDRDFDEDAGKMLVNGYPVQLWMYGSKLMRSEVERSLESGYRVQSGQRWSVDISAFWSYYDRLRGVAGPVAPTLSFSGGQPQLSSAVVTCNCGEGRSFGGEVWGTWQVKPAWRLSPSYSYISEDRWLPSSPYLQYLFDGTPARLAHQAILRSQHDLPHHFQLNFTARGHSRDEDLFHLSSTLGS